MAVKNVQENNENYQELTERQKRAIPFFVAPKSIVEACQLAGITTETFYTWSERTPAFRAELSRLRTLAMQDGLEQIRNNVALASQRLVELLGSQSEETRRKAACNILEYSLKIEELREVEQRLESIETIVLERRQYR
jgi:hypothetical protein